MIAMIAEMIGVYMIVNLTCIAARNGEGAEPILARILAFFAIIFIVYDLFHMGRMAQDFTTRLPYVPGLMP